MDSAASRWRLAAVAVPAAGRLVEALATSLGEAGKIERLDRNKDGLFGDAARLRERERDDPLSLDV